MLMKAISPRGNFIKMSSEDLPSRELHYLYHVTYFVSAGFCISAVLLSGPRTNTSYQEHIYVPVIYFMYKSLLPHLVALIR